MKRFAILAAFVTLIGCSHSIDELDNITNISKNNHNEFYASMPECDTRTFVEDNRYLRWNAGDEITVFAGNSYNSHWQFAGEDGANSGKFNEVEEDGFVTGIPLDLTANYAIYPYDENITISEAGAVSLTLPAVQEYNHTYANSFGAGANTMMAVTKNTSDNFLSFKNLCGYLKLKFYGENVTVKSVTVKGNNGEKIAGSATVTMAYGGEPTITMADDATDTITIDCGEGVALSSDNENPTIFWVAIPEITFEGGITIELTDINDQIFSKQTSNVVPIENNLIQPMAALKAECEAPINPENCKIYYTATKLIKPYDEAVFGANIVSNEWNETTCEGVITFDGEVTSLGDRCFYYNANLTGVIIPSSVLLIGKSAFESCSNLNEIELSPSIQSIGEYAFAYCNKLKIVILNEGLSSIGNGAFNGCSSLLDITIPSNITTISRDLFYGCTALTNITFPKQLRSIDTWAFYGCSNLKSITIPTNLTYIGTYAFDRAGTTNIYVEDLYSWFNITFANEFANPIRNGKLYYNGELLENIIIPNSVKEIKNYALYSLQSVKTITIPSSVTKIGTEVFSNCYNISEIYCKSAYPPLISDSNIFGSFFSYKGAIYVPASDDDSIINAYKSANVWSNYATYMEEYNFTE